jgi:hypothetical protein
VRLDEGGFIHATSREVAAWGRSGGEGSRGGVHSAGLVEDGGGG